MHPEVGGSHEIIDAVCSKKIPIGKHIIIVYSLNLHFRANLVTLPLRIITVIYTQLE